MKNTIHDLTMLYLEKHYKPGNDAPSDMVEEYCKVKEEVRKAKLYDGDVVIVRRQPTVESGETAIVMVNGNDATVKQVKEVDSGIMLIGHNTAVYEPHFYSQQEIANLPIQILGKVVELRRKF